MFTGIIQGVGVIGDIVTHGGADDGDKRLRIESDLFDSHIPAIGDSVSVDGVCLTAAAAAPRGFYADVSAETLSCTTLGELSTGRRVNLEQALTPSTPLGGHLVSGHVDGTGTLLERSDDARSVRLEFRAPRELARYIAVKGSICVDGVSLTINDVNDDGFAVNIVPHTLTVTTFAEFVSGRRVNLEVDLVARYLERLLEARGTDGTRGGKG